MDRSEARGAVARYLRKQAPLQPPELERAFQAAANEIQAPHSHEPAISVEVRPVALEVGQHLHGQELREVVAYGPWGDFTWGVFTAEMAEAHALHLRLMFEVVS